MSGKAGETPVADPADARAEACGFRGRRQVLLAGLNTALLLPLLMGCDDDRRENGGGAQGSPGDNAAFVPGFVQRFDGTHSAAIGVIDGADSAQVYTSFAGGYGGAYDSTHRRGDRATSARFTIAQGSDGDPVGADTGTGMGLWGANIRLPASLRCREGDTLHLLLVIRFDADFDIANNVGLLKFLRFLGEDPAGNVYGHVDHHLAGYGYVEQDTPAASPAVQTGWMWGNEADHSGEIFQAGHGLLSGIRSSHVIPRGEWVTLEFAQTFSSNPDLARRTTWLNGQRVADFHGNVKAWIDEHGNPASVNGGKVANLGTGATIDRMRLFTYWNGYAPKAQGVNVDTIAFHRIAAGESDRALPSVDSEGRRMIGLDAL